MAESGDYTPAPYWSGYDPATARKAYADRITSSLGEAVAAKVTSSDLVPDKLATDCESPLVICCDVTGSMGEWPKVIFSKLPYLEQEGKEYLGENMRISFSAVGDQFSDKYPLQVQEFVAGTDLKTSLEKLVHEQGGGGSSEESYDLAALYYAHNCDMPDAIRKPVFIFIGDEGLYRTVNEDGGRIAKASLVNEAARSKTAGRSKAEDKSVTIEAVFAALKAKFSVYVIRKPYNCTTNDRSARDIAIEDQWIGLLGGDHVVGLPEAARVVDVIFGILAKETGRIEYFEKELTDRQLADKGGKAKVDVVLKSLASIHKTTGPKALPDRAKSVTKKTGPAGKSRKSISLLDDEDTSDEE